MDEKKSPDYRKLQCRVSYYEWKLFKELETKGITVRQILETYCDKCKDINIVIFDKKNGNPVELPTNLITPKK